MNHKRTIYKHLTLIKSAFVVCLLMGVSFYADAQQVDQLATCSYPPTLLAAFGIESYVLMGAVALLTAISIYLYLQLSKKDKPASQQEPDAETTQLKQLQNSFVSAFDLISDGFASISDKGTVEYCNEQASKHFGLKPIDLIGKVIWEALPQFKESKIGSALLASLQTGKSQSIHIQRSADLKWFEIGFYPGKNRITLIAKDVTREEEALRLLELTNQVARIGGWEYLIKQDRIHLSAVAQELLHVQATQIELDKFISFFGTEGKELLHQLQNLKNGGKHFDAELAVFNGSNQMGWVKIIGETTTDNLSGMRILGTIQDIQNRVAYQEKMADTAQQYRSLFDLTPVPMWTFDAKSYKIIAANAAAATEYGYEQEELLQRTISQMFYPGVFSQFAKQLSMPSTKAQISEHRRKNGQRLYVEMYYTEIEHEKKKAFLLLARDITERLNNMRAIESQNQRLREIAWMQSHKVRAPLARILAIAQLIEPEYFDPAHDRHLVDEICKSAHELDEILMEIVQRTENSNKTE
jgi:PAS domain S-box-containing protein